jgi:hypothetical protein
MMSAMTALGIAVGGTLICYLLLARSQNRRTGRGSAFPERTAAASLVVTAAAILAGSAATILHPTIPAIRAMLAVATVAEAATAEEVAVEAISAAHSLGAKAAI